ncbi:DNA primase [Caminibacter mediatlanticus TB-2]|uniref:DNA primase n=1 Tax=Caminibacter mediatlanticus TB-2 TaxID=391592 RepID=A0AAI9AI17_9BACT|nr:DNA primase [Caminibacter mediatlanticus]EDM23859.1 DNA primase [Caminibacter mediatlanticus TB-2]QCT94758.1 DNA primase [Caminibacter mediatlanticus TB-2]
MISKESIENLKSIIDIVDVISNYIELKKTGSNYKALCPFHSEKTPSFVVSPAKQIYHCFGCGASGDAIKFIMEIEKLSYKEAIEKLATMYNFKLTYTSNNNFLSIDLLEKVNNFYKGELYKQKEAYEYLKQRGLFDSTIEKFELGYAPESAKQLKFFKDANLNKKELINLGVLVENGDYPRLIQRITFPIFSQSGKIIAFGGRTITNHPAKYINFTNTKIFNKSKTFYGLNFAREHILRQKEAIIVEGYMDVIMLHQAGIENSIATLGTALTKEHLPILKKINPKVKIAYDSDLAGINAAIKASKLLFSDFFDGGVVLFPENLDPADVVKSGGEINKFFENEIPFSDFIIDFTIKKYNIKNVLEKKKAIDEFKEYIASLPEILKEDFSIKVSQRLQISPNMLKAKSKHTISHTQNINLNKKIDVAEASIIKTLYENKEWMDNIVEYLSPEMFNTHKEELQLVYQEDFENPKLLDIVLRDDIMTLDYDTLKKQIIRLLIPYYRNKLIQIRFDNSINSDEKAHLMKIINYKLKELKKGKLVESTLTF